MTPDQVLPHKVVLVDYSKALFWPIGFEAAELAKVGASWETYNCTTEDEVLEVAADADVVVIQSVAPLLTAKVLAKLDHCRCTIRAGAGYDSIDYKAATKLGIMVCNAPTYCTDDVADHAIALMLSAVRHIPRLNAAMRAGIYDRAPARPTRRVRGSTLGIIGLGRIGSTVARRVRGWEMNVISYDPYVDQASADEFGVTMVELDELLKQSDFITIHCPLTDETRHLLGPDQFALMKDVVLANTARGPILNEQALAEAAKDGKVWAAGLDVQEVEPPPESSELWKLDNIILTPHISANSTEAQEDLYRIVVEICSDVVQGRVPQWVQNRDVLDHLKPVN